MFIGITGSSGAFIFSLYKCPHGGDMNDPGGWGGAEEGRV